MMQYQTHRRAAKSLTPEHKPAAKGPPLRALQAGAAPAAEQLGRPVDLPDAIRSKMEASFGADLSGVRLYESQTVADAGAEAVTMGSRIGFAPGKLDFSSSGGQALLGHELSHVVSQARGEVTGSGFLNDHALEARADREGAMAAAGESIYTGPVTPVSASSTTQAVGPMQAKKGKQKLSPEEAAAAQRSHDLEHLAESARINAYAGNNWDAQMTYEDNMINRFGQEDRMQLLEDLWRKKLGAARTVNQLGTAKGSVAAATSEDAERFQSFTDLGSQFTVLSAMMARTEEDTLRSYNDMRTSANSALSPEEVAEIDAATELLDNGRRSLSPEEQEELKDTNVKKAQKLRRGHKKKWGVKW